MNNLERDRALNTLIINRASQEAFLTFYAEDVVAQENDEPERVGREPWMQARKEMERKIKRFDARFLAHAANGDTTFSEWEYSIDLEGVGAITIAQVAVRRWREGMILSQVVATPCPTSACQWNGRAGCHGPRGEQTVLATP